MQNLNWIIIFRQVTVSSANTYSYKRYSMKLKDYLDKYVISKPDVNELYEKLKYGNETWYFFGGMLIIKTVIIL